MIPPDLPLYLRELEREAIEEALRAHRGNRTRAARAMGLTLRQIRYRMQKLGMKINVVLSRHIPTESVGRPGPRAGKGDENSGFQGQKGWHRTGIGGQGQELPEQAAQGHEVVAECRGRCSASTLTGL